MPRDEFKESPVPREDFLTPEEAAADPTIDDREESAMTADETPTVPPEDPAQPQPEQPDPTAPGVEPDRDRERRERDDEPDDDDDGGKGRKRAS